MLTPHGQAATPAPASIRSEGCIHRWFERWAAATPDAPAVTCDGRTISYAELDRLAERVARCLRSMGAGPDVIVGLLLERSIDLVVGLLGILKADAAYLPLDPGHPPERRAWMLADAKVRVVITQERFDEELREVGMVPVLVDGSTAPAPTSDEAPAGSGLDAGEPSCPPGRAGPDHLAYVIYTSGSTGRPKGVMVTHHNVVRLMASTESLFGFGASDITTLFHSIAFDFSVWELWGALAYGGRLVVVPLSTARDPLAFRELLVTERVTVLNQTPSAFRYLIEADQSADRETSTLALRWVIFGGEALPMRLLVPWFERHGDEHPRLVNMYGITETTVHVTWRVLSAGDVERGSLIGAPLSDLEILLLGDDLLPVADGETGEIHVGGPGLARGYLDRPELTAERFIPHPFSNVPGKRLYRSGDLARRLSDGELEYRGRSDQQVKIRGHRVEPGEIETTLVSHPSVRAAAVIPFRGGDETSLAAFLVRRDGGLDPIDGLRPWLESRLPSVFVPARLVPVESLPLNANGKLDRTLLLARLDEHLTPARGGAARHGTESLVATMWQTLLRAPAPGRDDDFFALGGHSLAAMRLVAAIQGAFHVRLPVTTVFETRTLSRLAAVIDGALAEGAERTTSDATSAESLVTVGKILPAQRGMWLLDALLPDRATYNQPFAYRPEGPVDWERFRESLRRVMARHPALRSVFEGGDEGPEQRVVPIESVPVPWSVEPAVDERAIGSALQSHARIPFDLTTAPLWRATLFPAAAPHGVLLLNFHHAIIDNWSIDLLLHELAEPAAGESDERRPPAEASRLWLPDLGVTERDRCSRFWRDALADATGELAWPGRWSPWGGGPSGGMHRFGIDAEASAALREVARETGATTFQILLAVFHGWLHRVTGADDVVVGTPVSLRRTPEVQASVNCFVNTLPVRVRWDDEGDARRTFTGLVDTVRETFLAAVSHGDLPFDEIVAAATASRAGERPPIVTTLFVHTDKGLAAARLGGVHCEPIPVDTGTAKFDLTLFLEGDGAELKGAFEYDRRRFDEATIAGFAASFAMFLRSVLSTPAEPLEAASLLSAEERQRVVHDWNATATDLGPPATLQGLFAAQVLRSPSAVALDCGQESLSYAQLSGRVNRLARFLRSRGVGPDVPVAVCLERSVEMVVALLGVVTAGGAYLPLDPEYPSARIATMLESAAPPVVIIQKRFHGRVAGTAGVVLDIDVCREDLDAFGDGPLDDIASPEDLAYVIYTSGSTGAPKGVMNTHAGIVNRLRWMQQAYRIDAGDRVLQKTPFGFDVSVWEFFWPLLTGARIVMAPPGLHRDPSGLASLVEAVGITVIHFVPSMLEVFLDVPDLERSCRSLRHVFASGEALGEAAMRRCLQRIPARLHNLYGPTEAAVDVTCHECRPEDPPGLVPIGRPIANMRTYVLDRASQPVATGVEGELWLAGVGVARGYFGRPDLTAERFRPDSFVGESNATMYRTGDLVRWRADGEIEYLGRLDHQVKIRGVRIELGEIEAELTRIEGVTRSVVIDREITPGDRRLIGYLVTATGAPDDEAITRRLATRLPEAMVPWRFVRVDSLPVNANGKLDRAALPLPDDAIDAGVPSSRSLGSGATEEVLALIWCDLLRCPSVGRDDDFFALGGHSLAAMRLVAAIQGAFRVRLPVKAVFETRTLSRLAAVIDGALAEGAERTTSDATSAESLVTVGKILPAQRGMWLLDALLPDRATYNQPFAYRPEGPVDWERFRESLRRVMARHPALRSVFEGGDDGPEQRVVPIESVPTPWSVEPAVDETAIGSALQAHARIPFDLTTAPLWRATLFPAAAPHGVLLLNFHHAIIDDWSIGLLLHELSEPAGEERDDGRPAVEATQLWLPGFGGADRDRCFRFWHDTLAGATGALAWPGRWTPWDGGSTGGMHRFGIGADASVALREVARETGATTFQILLAAFHGWLHRVTGADDVVVGTPVSLRRTPEVQASVNCFVNTLPVRVRWDDEDVTGRAFTALVGEVRETFLATVSHGDLPFDEIVAAATASRGGERPPIVTTLFVHTEKGLAAARFGGVHCEPIPVETGTAKFDLTLFLEGDGAELKGAFEYDRRRFDEATIAGFAASFSMFLRSVLSTPMTTVARASLLDDVGRERMLRALSGTAEPSNSPTGLLEPFLEQASLVPDSMAVTWEGGQWTYRELQQHAERIAAQLRLAGVAIDMPIAICLPRSPELLAAILGVLMAKGCSVPLDPALPVERLASMLTIAGCPLVVADGRTVELVDRLGTLLPPEAPRPRAVRIDAGSSTADVAGRPEPATPERDDDHRAYILFTSGSTGVPKGVEMPVGGLSNLVAWQCCHSTVRRGARTLQYASAGFDVSFQEIFSTWLAGGELVIVPEALRLDPAALLELVMDRGVERIFVPVAVLEHVAEAALAMGRFPPALREVIVAGEQLRISLAIRDFFTRIPDCILWNQYGPTESHVVTAEILAGPPRDWPDLPSIGRPVAGASIRVLDGAMEPVPVDVAGEIWIGGDCVARGYAGRADLTAERFVADPFAEGSKRRLYRSGDIGRWRTDGRLEYLGRVDRQVKIRGHRVEPDEVEAVLAGHPLVAEAAVVARRGTRGEWYLVACVVPVAGAALHPSEVREWLARRLPAAMIPDRIGSLEALPLTPNGKIDRSRLPDPAPILRGDIPSSPPRGAVEEGLAAMWCDLLGIPSVGRDDGFFARGGHSLLSMRLVAAIERTFGVRLPVRAVFETPKLADLAARISQPPAALPESSVALTTLPASDEVMECRPVPAQRGMWLLQALLPDPATYNVPIGWRVAGPIDWPRVERALTAVVRRHPALRTALVEVDGDIVQRILPATAVAVPWQVIEVADESRLPAAVRLEASTPFDLAVAPLVRAVRLDVVGADPVLMLVFHHAIIDEWSIGIVRADLAAAYAADDGIAGGSLPVVTVARDPTDIERDRRFWREELAGAPPETPLPGRPSASVVESSQGRSARFAVARDDLDRLRDLAGRSGVTLFNLLLASAHAWLERITGHHDLVIGTPVATRGAAETAGAVGCLINVLPVRLRFPDGPTAESLTLPGLATRVQEIFLRALDHADLPFDQIVAAAMPTRHGSRQPLVNVLLTVVETGDRIWSMGGATLRPHSIDTGLARFDLSLTLVVGADGLEGTLELPFDRFDEAVASGFASRYGAFLAEAVAGTSLPIGTMAMLPAEQRRLVIEDFNATAVDLGRATTLHELVLEQATRTPGACALSAGDVRTSYGELRHRATRLAARLRRLGIGSGDRVGVALPRSIDAIVAMLAVLRCGAAWVPLDRQSPPSRLAFIVGDARLAAIIDHGPSFGGWPAGIAVIDPAAPDRGERDEDDFPAVDPDAPAYVMYTSGSTGQPKGGVIPHAAVVNYLRGKQRRFPLDAGDVVLHSTRTTFDISVYEVFGPLLAGAALSILPPGRTDPVQILELVRGAGVTVAQFVPSLLALLVDDEGIGACPTLRRVFCGGEAMPSGLMKRFLDRSAAELVNVYGPTEATVWATAWVCARLPQGEAPPIGRPLDNVRCYVLDGAGRPVPVGTVGELFLGGAQLALGYHERPELTAERFLPDPFAPGPGARMYRTGDACRWRHDGLLEFVTRTDQQVKIRGHRIEPAEIEACLAGHPRIAAVAVVVLTGEGPASLVAGLVPRGSGLESDALRRWTAERLPEVMVPSRFVSLERIPVNANGKLDRATLATQIAESAAPGPARPAPPDARPPMVLPVFASHIRAAWQRVFGRVDFGDDENFFHDLGGHSIMAARLAADLSSGLGRRVPLAAVFEAPTVASMVGLLRNEGWKPRFRTLVPLQPFGAGPPLFLVHGVGGGIGETLELARACGPDVPVYGVQAIDRDGGEMQRSLEAMGELYAAEIVAFQPKGPYFLGGFSLGGWFAYETARQLRLAGHEVALLAQFDTHINCTLPREVVAEARRTIPRQYLWKHLRRIVSHPAQGWRYLVKLPARIKLARRWRAADAIPSDRHGQLVARYRPLPYDGPVDYFQSVESLPAVVETWQRWCRGGLTVHRVPGDHHQVIFGSNAAVVASIVRGILEQRGPCTGRPGDLPEPGEA